MEPRADDDDDRERIGVVEPFVTCSLPVACSTFPEPGAGTWRRGSRFNAAS